MRLKPHLSVVSSGVALGLAVAASLWIALAPGFYQGVSQSAGPPGSPPPPPVRTSATFLEVNGLWGGIVLLVPVSLAILGLLISRSAARQRRAGRAAMWGVAMFLLIFCGLAAFTIGTFYLPAAIAMLVGAIFSLRRERPGCPRLKPGT